MKYQKINKLIISVIISITILFSSVFSSSAVTYDSLKKNPQFRYGVDVSLWNDDLDWSILKDEGVEFAYIRVGYYNSFGGHLDKRFKQNVIGCVENGIEFGVYVYSYVYSASDNIKCAKWIDKQLKQMGNYCKDKDTIQVAYDIEDRVQLNALSSGRISPSGLQKSVEDFCKTIDKAGYIPAVYSFSSFFKDFLDVSKLQSMGVKIWVAQWPNLNSINIAKKVKIDGYYPDVWQYGCTLRIAGTIFDTNVCYGDFYDYKNEDSDLRIENLKKHYTYKGRAKTPEFNVYDGKKLLKKNKDYRLVYFNNDAQGEARVKIIRYKNDKYIETKTVIFYIWDDTIKQLECFSYKKKIKLKWDEVYNADYYEIYFFDKTLNKYSLLEETELNETVLTELDKNEKYKFKIRAVRTIEKEVYFGKNLKFSCLTK